MTNTAGRSLFGLRWLPFALLAAGRALFSNGLPGAAWALLAAIAILAFWLIDRYYIKAGQRLAPSKEETTGALLALLAAFALFGADDYFNPTPVFFSFVLIGAGLGIYGAWKQPVGASLIVAAGLLSIALGLAPLFGLSGERHATATTFVLSGCLLGLGLLQHRALTPRVG